MHRILVWDWPTRLVHWLFVALVSFSWGSAEYGHMDLHRYSGYTILSLLVFRIYWGVFGGETARFKNFVRGPRAIVDYLRNQSVTIGHNPLGALSVLALLTLLVTQVSLGLFAVDVDGIESGPLSHLVSFETGRTVAKAHGIVFNILLAFIALHIVAVLYYLIAKRDNLTAPMVTGRKSFATQVTTRVEAPLVRIIVGILLSAAILWMIV